MWTIYYKLLECFIYSKRYFLILSYLILVCIGTKVFNYNFSFQIILVLKSLKLYEITHLTIAVQIISHVLAYTNSCINPVLYAFLSDNFRKAFRKVSHRNLSIHSMIHILNFPIYSILLHLLYNMKHRWFGAESLLLWFQINLKPKQLAPQVTEHQIMLIFYKFTDERFILF